VAASFPAFFVEQGFDRVLLLAVAAAAAFLLLVLALVVLLRQWIPWEPLRVNVVSLVVVLAVWASLLPLYEATALWYRSVPHGSGFERMGADRDAFVSHMRESSSLRSAAACCSVVLVEAGVSRQGSRLRRSALSSSPSRFQPSN
jgi:hypothetical protein